MTREKSPRIEIEAVLSRARLPALPQSAVRLLELSLNPANGPSEFAAPIESDPGLAGQVLRFVNSSYFGFSREIPSVKQGMTLVGVHTIKNFILWSAIFSLLPNPQCGDFDLEWLRQDSLRRALFASKVMRILDVKDAEAVFVAALLQDMAVPMLAKKLPAVYGKFLTVRRDRQVRLSALEAEAFGWTHAKAAALLARQWNLPEDIAILIESHLQTIGEEPIGGQDLRGLAVALSSHLPSLADPDWDEAAPLEAAFNRLRPAKPVSLTDVLGQIDREFAEFAAVLKITPPPRSLVDSYAEAVSRAAN
jgi:HD-like signal output (HDOD) protein